MYFYYKVMREGEGLLIGTHRKKAAQACLTMFCVRLIKIKTKHSKLVKDKIKSR